MKDLRLTFEVTEYFYIPCPIFPEKLGLVNIEDQKLNDCFFLPEKGCVCFIVLILTINFPALIQKGSSSY